MDGVLIVARPVLEGVVKYQDGDVAPLHQTLVYMGDTSILPAAYIPAMLRMVSYYADGPIISSKVIGTGFLGKDGDPVTFTESYEMAALQARIASDELVVTHSDPEKQHPSWIPHISGDLELKYGDLVTFDRICFWYGDLKYDIPFSNQPKLVLEV